ncbi:MAG TPA: phosphate ABC transporter substrate-binding protein [Lachnospiraceae bacterium]|nr:phosphate ABC transporter substrate-binding protein [Lachnospiraceae bacterium]
MKKRGSKLVAILGAAVLTAGALAGCGSTSNGNAQPDSVKTQGEKELSGKISLSGSTSMQKLSDALCESFMDKYPNVTATTEYTGSSAGIEAVIVGQSDIGNSSRSLKQEEKANGAVENIVAIDGIAVVVDKANTVTDLTKDQLISIYTGTTTNWSEFGGADVPIVVIGREAGSGTRGAFEEILKIEDECAYVNELDSTGAVMARVSSTPGAIAYVSLDVVDDTVTALSLDGVEATAEKIKTGEYFLSRPFVMATKGEISEQSELLQAWFEYVMGEEGQAVATQVGLITVE